jgi:chemotaxis protein methyltransferase CheR
MHDAAAVRFLQWALPRLELRWAGFRRVRRQVVRRLVRRMAALGIRGFEEYRRRLLDDPAEWEALDRCCRATVTRFHRDREIWRRIRQEVLPAQARRARAAGRSLRAWSAACASGEEPVTLALAIGLELVPETGPLATEIVATDIDAALLERARRGRWSPGAMRDLPAGWRERAFARRGDALALAQPLPVELRYERQDLRRQAPEGPFDLVLCRNLPFTYFSAPLARAVLLRIESAVGHGSVLVLGRRERLPVPAAGWRRRDPAAPLWERVL